MSNTRKETWLALIVLAIALPAAAIVGIVTLDTITSPPLHPNPAEVPSMAGSAPPPTWSEAVERGRQIARAALTEQNLPGLSVAIGIRDDIVWAEGFGWADVKNRVPVGPEFRFRIGHASKPLTSAAVGLLLEQHRLNLDEPIQTYVPAFPRKQWPVTLRQLMAHVAGVRHYSDTEWGDRPTTHCARASEGLQAFASDPLLFEPGTQYRYSTYGWVLVSAAVEAVAKESFFAFMNRQVFGPLGMTATMPDSAAATIPARAMPYIRSFGLKLATDVEFSCFAGAGGFLSTPSDLVRFGLAMENDKLLKPSTVGLLRTPHVLESGEETDYGLGWMLETVPLAGESTRMVGHGARTVAGGTTSLAIFPGRGMVVAVMTNLSFADTKSVALSIADAFSK